MPLKVQESYKTQIEWTLKKRSPHHLIIIIQNMQNIEKSLRAAKEVTNQGRTIRNAHNFSTEILKGRRSQIDMLQALRDHGYKPRLLYSAKLSITIDAENKIFKHNPDLKNTYIQIQPQKMYQKENFNSRKLIVPAKTQATDNLIPATPKEG